MYALLSPRKHRCEYCCCMIVLVWLLVQLNVQYRLFYWIESGTNEQDHHVRARLLLIVDVPKWAHHFKAKHICRNAHEKFICRICFHNEVRAWHVDSSHVIVLFYWSQLLELQHLHDVLDVNRHKIMIGVSSHHEIVDGMSIENSWIFRKFAQALFVNNMFLLSQVPRDFRLPVYYTSNGVDTQQFTWSASNECSRKNEWTKVGFVGAIKLRWKRELKGYDLIEKAVSRLDRVRLMTRTGGHSIQEMADFYRSVDVLVVASSTEGTPNPALEALASGVPVITTCVGNMPEVIVHNVNGFFVERNSDSIRKAIQTFSAKSASERCRMQAAARKSVAAFDWKQKSQYFLRAFSSVYQSNADKALWSRSQCDQMWSDVKVFAESDKSGSSAERQDSFAVLRTCNKFHSVVITSTNLLTLQCISTLVHLVATANEWSDMYDGAVEHDNSLPYAYQRDTFKKCTFCFKDIAVYLMRMRSDFQQVKMCVRDGVIRVVSDQESRLLGMMQQRHRVSQLWPTSNTSVFHIPVVFSNECFA